MKIFGLCTTYGSVSQFTYEQYALYLEAQRAYDRVLLINPRRVNYLFIRDVAKPVIQHGEEDLSSLTSLMVRSTKNSEAAVAVLAHALKACGCDVLDPLERFSVGKASKLLTTLSRFRSGLGTSTYVSFTRSGARQLLERLADEGKFPLLTKPIAGRQGQGVARIDDLAAGMACIDQYFGTEEYLPDPFFCQDFVEFRKEYRVMVVDGRAISIVEKVKAPGQTAANAAQGSRFVAAEAPGLVELVVRNVSPEGILGVDVAVDAQDRVHLIETNRAPQWEVFEQATGINVAKIIIERAVQRLNPPAA
jgi:glutathione synthase/RimK-type ligase-like ATP-grasp enzyme